MIIAANWKMNLNEKESIQLIHKINQLDINNHQMIIFPAVINLCAVAKELNENVALGCQNFFPYPEGAYTGEICLSQIPTRTTHVLIGHSERRNILNESNELIQQKCKYALKEGYDVILCVGESLDIYNQNKTIDYLFTQIDEVLNGQYHPNIKIAYEPIWAIGSGQTPTAEEVNSIARQIFDKTKLDVLYGGSVNENNIKDFTNQEYIKGVLIGGASLKYEIFKKIIELN